MKKGIYELESAEKRLKTFFKNRVEILLSYLFGSYVERPTGGFHDIDIAVLVIPGLYEKIDKETPYGYAASLNAQIAHILKYNFIDLVILNDSPPLILRRVIGDGKLIFCRSEKDRIRFEVESLKRYADTEHIRSIKRLYMAQRIEKGLVVYG